MRGGREVVRDGREGHEGEPRRAYVEFGRR